MAFSLEWRTTARHWERATGGMTQESGSDVNPTATTTYSSTWYSKAIGYWNKVDASCDGVLGGYGSLNACDVRDSERFLIEHMRQVFLDTEDKESRIALDIGAGVGRVTENLLIHFFDIVDLEEPIAHFRREAEARLRKKIQDCHDKAVFKTLPDRCRYINMIEVPAQDFIPEKSRYTCIWIQWCIGHLQDEHLISFLKRCRTALKNDKSRIFVKENICESSESIFDEEDSSVTRSSGYFESIFAQTGLQVVARRTQKGFPLHLFKVITWCMR